MTLSRLCLLLALLSFQSAWAIDAHKNQDEIAEEGWLDDIEEFEGFKDIAVDLPPWPDDDDLERLVSIQERESHQVYIDIKNLKALDNGALIYSVVIESGSGVRNFRVEGVRCHDKLARTLAFGNSKGEFRKTSADWEPASTRGVTSYQNDMLVLYACDIYGTPLALEQIRDRVRLPEVYIPDFGSDNDTD